MTTDSEMEARTKVLGVARELYGRVAYTHKTHEKDREIWTRKVRQEKWANVVVVGLTAVAAIVGAICDDRRVFVAASILGALSTAFVVYQLSFNACKMESDHRNAAKKLLSIRERYLMLILRLVTDKTPVAELNNELEALQAETCLVYESAPDTSAQAYSTAGTGIKDNEELTFSEAELDRLLPMGLRVGNTADVGET